MIPTIITNVFKPAVAAVMSLTMAMNGTLSGPSGEYAKLYNKAMMTNPAKTETQINFMLDLGAIEELVGEDFGFEEIPEVENIYKDGKLDISATFYTYDDSENIKAALSFTENLSDGYVIYFDANGMAATPKLVDTVLSVASAIDEDSARTYDIYKKYFADNGFYIEWNKLFGIDETDPELMEAVGITCDIVKDVCEIIGKEENANAIAQWYAPTLDISEKYYTEVDVDGVKGYGAKINGVQLLEFSSDIIGTMYSEENLNKLFDCVLGFADNIDYLKYIEIFLRYNPEYAMFALPEGVTNEQIADFVKVEAEAFRGDFIEYMAIHEEEYTILESVVEYYKTGKDEKNLFDEQTELTMVALKPFVENSYIEEVIYEKDGVIKESAKISVSDGKAVFGELELVSGVSAYNGTLPNTADVVPFDKRVEAEEIDNKLGYEDARAKGVHSIEIYWDTFMTPEDNVIDIFSTYFYVNYNTLMGESVLNDPAFAGLDEETMNLVIGMYEDSDFEYKYCDSSAQLIDNSVYLPLRQIMENAGYDVSWDGNARKAYVSVGGENIEMTGIIVNDRTYVKVRDFEKLGAVVDYEEEFYYQNAYNDFYKSCNATITFAAEEETVAGAETVAVIEEMYGIKAPQFMIMTMPVDLSDEFAYKTYLGLDDASVIKEAAVSESMIGAQAYSLVVAKVNEGVNASEIAEKMKAGIDPRKWICVEADDVKVVTSGDMICFCMVSTNFAPDFTADDMINAFKTVVQK